MRTCKIFFLTDYKTEHIVINYKYHIVNRVFVVISLVDLKFVPHDQHLRVPGFTPSRTCSLLRVQPFLDFP